MTLEYKILEQKGIGRCIGKAETNFGKIDLYEKYVELTLSSGNYTVRIFHNPEYSKNILDANIDCGANLIFAKLLYTRIIEKDKIEKQNLIHKIFNKN